MKSDVVQSCSVVNLEMKKLESSKIGHESSRWPKIFINIIFLGEFLSDYILFINTDKVRRMTVGDPKF